MKKIKHKKHRNTGLIFEMLVKKMTSNVLQGEGINEISSIIKKHFSNNSEIRQELTFYQMLTKEKLKSPSLANEFIESIKEARNSLDLEKLNKEKYRLYKDITSYFGGDSFFDIIVENYQNYASIYTLFEYNQLDNPPVMVINKQNLIECICNVESSNNTSSEYLAESEDIRLSAFEIMIEKYNDKYNGLLNEQKTLLGNYINMETSSDEFKTFITSETNRLKESINSIIPKIENVTSSNKLNEMIDVLNQIDNVKFITEDHIHVIMKYYEFVNVIEK
jgi:hypothetical protein